MASSPSEQRTCSTRSPCTRKRISTISRSNRPEITSRDSRWHSHNKPRRVRLSLSPFYHRGAIMRIARNLNPFAVVLATGSMLVATAAGALPSITGVCSDATVGTLPSCTCKSPSGYTISLSTETPTSTQVTYTYSVSGSGNAKVNAIRDVQVIVPRPVATSNQNPAAGNGVIQDGTNVTGINTYCQPDPNSG